jgi:hypothetical protein
MRRDMLMADLAWIVEVHPDGETLLMPVLVSIACQASNEAIDSSSFEIADRGPKPGSPLDLEICGVDGCWYRGEEITCPVRGNERSRVSRRFCQKEAGPKAAALAYLLISISPGESMWRRVLRNAERNLERCS